MCVTSFMSAVPHGPNSPPPTPEAYSTGLFSDEGCVADPGAAVDEEARVRSAFGLASNSAPACDAGASITLLCFSPGVTTRRSSSTGAAGAGAAMTACRAGTFALPRSEWC